jgi:hypothetical protein
MESTVHQRQLQNTKETVSKTCLKTPRRPPDKSGALNYKIILYNNDASYPYSVETPLKPDTGTIPSSRVLPRPSSQTLPCPAVTKTPILLQLPQNPNLLSFHRHPPNPSSRRSLLSAITSAVPHWSLCCPSASGYRLKSSIS